MHAEYFDLPAILSTFTVFKAINIIDLFGGRGGGWLARGGGRVSNLLIIPQYICEGM